MSDGNMYQDLGRVEGKLDSLVASAAADREETRKSRKGMYDQLAALTRGVDDTRARLEAAEKRLAAIEPFAINAAEWEMKGKGALIAVGVLAGGVGTGIAAFGKEIMGLWP